MNEEMKKRYVKRILPIALALGVLVFAAVFLETRITGLFSVSREFNYSDDVSLSINESYEYGWVVGNSGKLKSLRLDGSYSKDFVGKVYLDYDGDSYLVLDSSFSGILGVTGLVVGNETVDDNESYVNETNVTVEINVSSENVSGENGSDVIENRSIDISVIGGGRRALDEVFILNVSSVFDWDIDYSKVCTRWVVNEVGLCYGNNDCCALVELYGSGEWNDSLYLTYGRYGSGLENSVKAQVIYANYSLSVEDPYLDVWYSEVYSLTAEFYEERVEFSDVCLETCLLSGFNDSSYLLRFEVSSGNIKVDGVRYSVEKDIEIGDSCVCPESGDWEIINGDDCEFYDVCDVDGSFRVLNGSMKVLGRGRIRAKGCYVEDNHSLYVEDLSGLFCEKYSEVNADE